MANKKINSFYMETGLKKNWTMSDFCKDLNMNEEEFRRSLKKTFSAKTERYYLSRLDTQEKLARKHAKSQEAKNKPESETEKIKSVAHTEAYEELSEPSELETCKAKETELRDLIFRSEIEFQVLKEKKDVQTNKLRKVSQRLEAILLEGEKLVREIDSIKEKLTSIQNQKIHLGSKRADAKKELELVQAKIQQLEIITIFYTASGEIKPIGYEGEIPELQLDPTIKEMMEVDLLEDLTLKELRILARIIATAVYVKNTANREVKFDFEEVSNISVAIELMNEMARNEK